jgi:hypothetical protein
MPLDMFTFLSVRGEREGSLLLILFEAHSKQISFKLDEDLNYVWKND